MIIVIGIVLPIVIFFGVVLPLTGAYNTDNAKEEVQKEVETETDKFGSFSWWFSEWKKDHPTSKLTKEEVLENMCLAIPQTDKFEF